jgi:cytochrome c-type biogenesis protein CcmF
LYILGVLAFYIGGALLLFGLRVGAVAESQRFNWMSREAALVLNNLLLSVILVIVLVGTMSPIVAEALGSQISVGPPYYNPWTAAFALPLVAVMVLGPLLRWRQDDGAKVRKWAPLLIGAIVITIVLCLIFAPGMGILPLLGLALAVGVGIVSLAPLVGRNLRRTPLPVWGMVVAHFGVAVALVGMATESAFIKERLAAVRVGETVEVANWRVRLTDVRPVVGPNWTAVEAVLDVQRGNSDVETMRPQARTFNQPQTETNEAALKTVWNGQLYAVLGQSAGRDEQGRERWQLRLWWKPLVWFIWAGGGLIALGGLLSLIGRIQPLRTFRGNKAAA